MRQRQKREEGRRQREANDFADFFNALWGGGRQEGEDRVVQQVLSIRYTVFSEEKCLYKWEDLISENFTM